MIFQIFFINGRYVEFDADEYYFENGTYYFLEGGEVVGEFQKTNIAGMHMYIYDDED